MLCQLTIWEPVIAHKDESPKPPDPGQSAHFSPNPSNPAKTLGSFFPLALPLAQGLGGGKLTILAGWIDVVLHATFVQT